MIDVLIKRVSVTFKCYEMYKHCYLPLSVRRVTRVFYCFRDWLNIEYVHLHIGVNICNCSCFEIDQEMDAILLIIGIVNGVCWIFIKSIQQCTYFLFSVDLLLVAYFTLNSSSYLFSPFENGNYHRCIISLQANNLTTLSPYATELTSDR
jgi:hypothetical protein